MKKVYTLPKSRILLLLFALTLTAFSGAFSVSGQTPQVGDYRSNAATMNWTTASSWQIYTTTGWTTATAYPGQNAIVGTGAVTIQAGHTVTANFTTNTNILYNNLAAVTTPNPIGKLTINTGGKLTLPGNDVITYIKTPEISVLPTTGTIFFNNKANLALPTDAVVSLSTGGLSGTENANVKIYIGSLWYAVGVSNSAQYTFQQLMAAGGTINAEITTPPSSTICQGDPVSLQGYFTGAYTSITSTAITPYGASYIWYDTHDGGTKTQIATGTIQLSTTTNTTIATAANASHTAISQTLLPGTHNLEFYVVTYVGTTAFYNSAYRTVVVNTKSTAPSSLTQSPATVCSGSSSTLTVGGGTMGTNAVYQWSTDNFATILQESTSTTYTTPALTATTTYQVRRKDPAPCSTLTNSISVTVTVNTPSTAPTSLTASPATICSGSTSTLTVSGGTMGTNAVYQWSNDNFASILQESASNTYTTPALTGTTTYWVRRKDPAPCSTLTNSISVTVTVNTPSTAPTSLTPSNPTICSGSSVALTANGGVLGTGASYEWGTGTEGTNIISGQTQATYTPSPTTTTTYWVRIVNPGPCPTTSAVSTTVTVNPLPQGSFSGNTICPDGTGQLTFTASAGTGPFTVVYNDGTNNSSPLSVTSGVPFNVSPNPTSIGTYNYTLVSVTDANGCLRTNGFTQGTATITVSNTATTWTGNTNTNWNEVGNWSCGIPIATSNVTIPATTNKPVVNIATAVCNNLSIDDGASLTVNPGQLLTVSGTITGAGTAASAGKIRVKASPDGTTANGSLIINCAANTSNPVFGTVEFYTKGNKATTAVKWTDNIPGSPTYNQEFNANYQWQFFGVPVKEVVANPTFYGSFLRKYREDLNSTTTGKWEVLNNTSKLEAFEGYEITQAAPKMIEIAGELQFCDKTLTLTRIAPVATDNIRFGLGQNIFGNSYTAAIKISKMVNTDDKVEKTVYLYNTGSLADWNAAGLITSPANNATMTAGSYISIPWNTSNTVWDDQIPSMQGFLLKYTTAQTNFNNNAAENAQVTLKYDDGGVAGNTRPQLAPKAAEEPLSYLRVNLQSKTTTDNLWLFSREGTSSNFDNGWDGHKHFGTPTAFIYSMTPDGPMQVNTDRTIDGSVINFYANSDTEYTLTLVKSNLDAYSDLKLIDFGTKTVTPLTAEMTRYNFTSANAGVVEKRFMIVNSASKIDFKKNDFSLLYGYLSADKTLIVTNFSGEPGTMTLSTASGVIVMNKPLTTGTSHFPTSLKAGAYVLTMEAGTSRASIKVLVNNK